MSTDTKPPVSPTCEHIEMFGDEAFGVDPEFCCEATAFWYPALGGGTMALCKAHAVPMLPRVFGLREYAELSL